MLARQGLFKQFLTHKRSTKEWSLLTLYGLFSKNKKQIAFSLFSGGCGVPNGVEMGSGGWWAEGEPPPTPSRPPFGPRNPQKSEKQDQYFFVLRKNRTMLTQIFLYRELIFLRLLSILEYPKKYFCSFLDNFCPVCTSASKKNWKPEHNVAIYFIV